MWKYIFILMFLAGAVACSSSDDGEIVPPPPEIPDEEFKPGNPNDVSGGLIQLAVTGGRDDSHNGVMDISKSFDRDLKTWYHSDFTHTDPAVHYPITLEYTLADTSKLLDYVVYTPRNGNGNFKKGELWVKTAEQSTYQKVCDFDFEGKGTVSTLKIAETVKNPRGVKFVLSPGTNNNLSCAEMEFYSVKPLSSDLDAVFTDKSYSELKPGVTEAQIAGIKNAFYANIARHLFDKSYPAFRILKCDAYQKSTVIRQELKTSVYSQLDNITGISVNIGEELVVFVGNTHGEELSLCVMNYDEGYKPITYMLVEGANKMKMKDKGLVYVIYQTTSYQTALPVRVHIAAGGENNGYYELGKGLGAQDWKTLLDKSVHPYMDIKGVYSHLCFPVKDFRAYTGNAEKLGEDYDKIVRLEHELMGLYTYNRQIKNRMCFVIDPKADNPNASDYRTVYPTGSMKSCCEFTDPWGPAHEAGHMLQTRPGLKWHGTTEVTNNILSMHVTTSMGMESRLETDGRNFYEAAFTNTIVAKKPHQAEVTSGDKHFRKLVPFWQLYLYSREGGAKNIHFYEELFERIRVESDPKTDGEAQLNFVRLACDVMQLDLTSFFRAWGFLRPIDMMVDDYGEKRFVVTAEQIRSLEEEIAAKGYDAAPGGLMYLHDSCVAAFKNKAAVEPGTAYATGKQVAMSGWRNVVAYEVYDGDKLVMVSHKHGFTVATSDMSKVTVKAIAWDGKATEVKYTN